MRHSNQSAHRRTRLRKLRVTLLTAQLRQRYRKRRLVNRRLCQSKPRLRITNKQKCRLVNSAHSQAGLSRSTCPHIPRLVARSDTILSSLSIMSAKVCPTLVCEPDFTSKLPSFHATHHVSLFTHTVCVPHLFTLHAHIVSHDTDIPLHFESDRDQTLYPFVPSVFDTPSSFYSFASIPTHIYPSSVYTALCPFIKSIAPGSTCVLHQKTEDTLRSLVLVVAQRARNFYSLSHVCIATSVKTLCIKIFMHQSLKHFSDLRTAFHRSSAMSAALS